jgi:hypothetical protein
MELNQIVDKTLTSHSCFKRMFDFSPFPNWQAPASPTWLLFWSPHVTSNKGSTKAELSQDEAASGCC